MKDLVARITSAKSTIMSVVTGLLTVLVAVKVISADALTEGLAATGHLYDAIAVLLGSGLTIYQLFTKDK